jgi:hypothetical protein
MYSSITTSASRFKLFWNKNKNKSKLNIKNKNNFRLVPKMPQKNASRFFGVSGHVQV